MVPATALINVNTTRTTPPRRLTVVQTKLPTTPSSPPLDVHVCTAVLYCTTTLTVFEGFDSSGSRSGEIFELSANAEPAISSTSHKAAKRASFRVYVDCIALSKGNRIAKDIMAVTS